MLRIQWFWLTMVVLLAAMQVQAGKQRPDEASAGKSAALRAAIHDLVDTFGDAYPHGGEYLERLEVIEATGDEGSALDELRREALLANPLIASQPILFVVRQQYQSDHHSTATLFQSNEINAHKFRGGGAIKLIDLAAGGKVRTLVESPTSLMRDPELSYDGSKVLFAMRHSRADDYHVYEIGIDGKGLRQITGGEGFCDIDPVYLPDGRIVFSSTRDLKYCQCNRHIMANLFRVDADGRNMIQIGGSGLFEGHPIVMPDGTILYDRWEYVDRQFGSSFGLWTMNPDGTNPALFYGNNAWAPGMVADARPVPGTHLMVATFGSCHDRPWGAIALVDRSRGLDGSGPVRRIWPSDARRWLENQDNVGWHTGGIDVFKNARPRYEDPYPLSEKYFLCSREIENERTGIYLIDVFGNEVRVHAEGPGCFDPLPVAARPRPAIVPARHDLAAGHGKFFVYDVYSGTGMEAIERGTIKYLRLIEAPYKRSWTQGNWNIDATQAAAMNWNLTNNKRIIGDVPVEADGSVFFKAPANTFLYFQALDENKMMVQSMRSGTLIQPGETTGCIGCHDRRLSAVPNNPRIAWSKPAVAPEPWYGPSREFNYLTEVQPVFDRHCVSCHDYGSDTHGGLNLAGDLGLVFNTSYLELHRKSATRWSPDPPGAPKRLIKAIHDGPPAVLPPLAWGSHRSKLIDVMRGEHYGISVSREDIERVATWIDLNAPYYGSYMTAYGDNPFGRSPLTGAQLERLSDLVGRPVGDIGSERSGSQVSFTRPKLSPCLDGFADKSDPKYAEALAIIEAGRDQLQRQAREDMLGHRTLPVHPDDVKRYRRYLEWMQTEQANRRAIVRQPADQ